MTNEEKARKYQSFIESNNPSAEAYSFYDAYISACNWKDKQYADIIKEECNASYESGLAEGKRKAEARFKEYLEKKMTSTLQARESFEKGSDVWWDYTTSATAIEEIINELFNGN